jgi:hypothetical protein
MPRRKFDNYKFVNMVFVGHVFNVTDILSHVTDVTYNLEVNSFRVRS